MSHDVTAAPDAVVGLAVPTRFGRGRPTVAARIALRMDGRGIEVRPVVVVPTKDNAATVAEVVRGCLRHLPAAVVVVDDGSTDGSGDRAREAGAEVLVHPENRGKGAALLTAFRWAAERGYTHAVTIDADGQHLPDDLPAFVAAARAEPTAIVAGCRDMATAPERSRFGRRFSNFWVWAETSWSVDDTQCGYRVYPIGPVLGLGLGDGRYELEVEVLVRALWSGMPVVDLPCRVHYPPEAERVSSFRPLADNARISLLNVRLVAERLLWPPRWRRHRNLRTDAWRDRHRGTFFGWWIVVTLIRWTGRWPAYAVVTGLAAWFAVFAPGRRRAVERFGRRLGKSGLGARWLAVRVFHGFALSLVDRFLLLVHGPSCFVFDRSEVGGAYDAVDAGQGLIVLSGHLGNPDLGASAFNTRIARRVNVLLYAGPSDPYVRLIREIAPERAPNVIALNDDQQHASITAIRALRRGEVVAIKADRAVDERVAVVPFLDGRVAIPTGPLLIAALSGAPVIVLGCFKEGARRYRVLASPARVLTFGRGMSRDEQLAVWAAELASTFEGWARRYPAQWYQFHDPFVG